MSFATSNLQNSYRPDRRILVAIEALTARVEALEGEKVILQDRVTMIETENINLRTEVVDLKLWALTFTSGTLEA